jgi:hypothetical protein
MQHFVSAWLVESTAETGGVQMDSGIVSTRKFSLDCPFKVVVEVEDKKEEGLLLIVRWGGGGGSCSSGLAMLMTAPTI